MNRKLATAREHKNREMEHDQHQHLTYTIGVHTRETVPRSASVMPPPSSPELAEIVNRAEHGSHAKAEARIAAERSASRSVTYGLD
jgi:hypothetical protein